tara:strand:+ start:796 stop:1167 length:372 start_codon:yes stop_codon:yes gene_type:complete
MSDEDKKLSATQELKKVAPKIAGSIIRMTTNQIFGGGGETSTPFPKGTDKIDPRLLTRVYDEIQARMDKTNDFDDKTLSRREKEKKLSKGGAPTKNRIGGNDYRKGGYVLNTIDNRKVKRNGK